MPTTSTSPASTPPTDPLAGFHPAVAAWFREELGTPTDAQARAWPAIRERRHTLVAAPTGSGKTLAAFLAVLDELVRLALASEDGLPDETRVVYVSPLKALSNDIHRNLELPLAGIEERLAALGLPRPGIRRAVRTGDTPASERTKMGRKPPHVLVTTPESLYILLGSESGRGMLGTARTVIVDEIHAVADDKRGSHLALSLERLDELVARNGGRLTRVGLSATQKPIDLVARFLVGTGRDGTGRAGDGREAQGPDGASREGAVDEAAREGAPPACEVIDAGHRRALDLGIEIPSSPLEAVMSNEVWDEVYDRLAGLIREHRTTIVFVNTRRLAERVTRHLGERLGDELVAAHHGSLSKEQRESSERRLKVGGLRAMVATASLELGIDVGSVELVCQVGSTRSIATLLQRVGRAGHFLGGVSKGRVFPLSRDELVESAALLDAVRRGELDRLVVPEAPLDVLAQQVVAAVAAGEWAEDDLYALVRRAWPYRDLPRERFDEVVEMLAQGFSTRRGRRSAYLHRDTVNRRLRARRGARITALTSGGAIPDTADFQVVLEPAGTVIGSVNEDFAVESLPGDVFQLGNSSWRLLKIEQGRVRVEDALGEPPSIPFWLGEAPGRTDELSEAVSRLRSEVERRLLAGEGGAGAETATVSSRAQRGISGHEGETDPRANDEILRSAQDDGSPVGPGTAAGREAAVGWLVDEVGVTPGAALQLVDYLAAARAALGGLPTRERLVVERFFDDAGDTHLVIHSPLGSRLNRAWGLALRKRFCRSFNFELQAAATEDAIVLSLGPTHSFELDTVFSFLHSATARDLLVQALLDAPMFGVRWRWNASRALALPRMQGGKKVPPQLQRHQAEDLLAVVFPDQLACLETIEGDREIPDHPLVAETLRDCLEEAMDAEGLVRLLEAIEAGRVETVARELTEPSPLAHEVLNARPYAYLDDAPLEERRTQAVAARRWLDPETAADLGALDPAAIERVREEVRPAARDADELHDALVVHGFLTAAEGEAEGWEGWLAELAAAGRATVLTSRAGARLWVAVERLAEVRAVHPGATVSPPPAGSTTSSRAQRGISAVPEKRGRIVNGEILRCAQDDARDDVAGREVAGRRSPVDPEAAARELLRSRLDGSGPVTAERLAADAGLPVPAVQRALTALETEGYVMRGRFTPAVTALSAVIPSRSSPASGDEESPRPGADLPPEEWCERRLLARIHRYTIARLRREIEPVSRADLSRFLLAWQKVEPGERGEGPEAVAAVLDQLHGFAAPAAAWEGEILPARVNGYDPAWLDALCLSGRYVWCRAIPPAGASNGDGSDGRGRTGPLRTTPITFLPGAELADWRRVMAFPAAPPAASGTERPAGEPSPGWRAVAGAAADAEGAPGDGSVRLSSDALAVHGYLAERGASFFADLARGAGLLHTRAERALAELAAAGLVTSDSFTGLRALLVPSDRRPSPEGVPTRRRGKVAPYGMESAGRWSLLTTALGDPAADGEADAPPAGWSAPPAAVETIAWTLLARYGVVFRALVARESLLPPWRELLWVLRRLEARGEVRGGRFVDGFSGEQFALPEAVARLRALRRARRAAEGEGGAAPEPPLVSVSAADPLNLAGILTPGEKVAALTGNRLLYGDGVPLAVLEAREVRFLRPGELEPAERGRLKQALVRSPTPPALRPYLPA